MGGLYVSPTSSEISWKRRAFRVSSEALLCLGVATIVASFVVEIGPTGQKPNIWILIGGLIMIIASVIGWSLTFCLMIDPEENSRRENNFTGIIIQSDQHVDAMGNKILELPGSVPTSFSSAENKLQQQQISAILEKHQGFFGTEYYKTPSPVALSVNTEQHQRINKMRPVDKNAPLHSVEVKIPPEFFAAGGTINSLPHNLSPSYFDQYFATDKIVKNPKNHLDEIDEVDETDRKKGRNQNKGGKSKAKKKEQRRERQRRDIDSDDSGNYSQLPGYSKIQNNYDPNIAKKLGQVPPTPKQKRVAGYEDAKTYNPSKRPKNTNNSSSDEHSSANGSSDRSLIQKARRPAGTASKNNNNRKKVNEPTYSSSVDSSSYSYSTEVETISHTQSSNSFTDSYTTQDYEEVKYNKKGERIRNVNAKGSRGKPVATKKNRF